MQEYERTKIGKCLYGVMMGAGRFLVRHPILAQILNLTWGLLGTLIGVIEMLIVLLLPMKKSFGRFQGFPYAMLGNNWGGLSGVLWFFVADKMGDDWTEHTKKHEIGHAFQNAVLGPLFVFVVSIPSCIRYWAKRIDKHNTKPYDSFWVEGSATDIGYYFYAQSESR